jgi:hypothetical protein
MAKASLIMFVEMCFNKELILRCQDGLFSAVLRIGWTSVHALLFAHYPICNWQNS